MRPQDAAAAVRAGADAIGMVFYPKAKRCISIDRAREIMKEVPPFVTAIGLFVDQPAEEIRQTAAAVSLSYLQFHGKETPEFVADLREFRIIKALHADRQTLFNQLELWRNSIESLHLRNLQGLILDTPATSAPGGTGVENDWELLAGLGDAGAPIIVAGGLTPLNVRRVVKLLNPYAVDVSSGVEENFGEKSAAKIEAFVSEVAAAFASC